MWAESAVLHDNIIHFHEKNRVLFFLKYSSDFLSLLISLSLLWTDGPNVYYNPIKKYFKFYFLTLGALDKWFRLPFYFIGPPTTCRMSESRQVHWVTWNFRLDFSSHSERSSKKLVLIFLAKKEREKAKSEIEKVHSPRSLAKHSDKIM